MGEAAARLADHVIVTSDNPRSEDPHAIIAQMLAGIAGDHAEAIERSPGRDLHGGAPGQARATWCCSRARATRHTRRSPACAMPFSDREVARAALDDWERGAMNGGEYCGPVADDGLDEAADAVGGEAHGAARFTGVTTDSRRDRRGRSLRRTEGRDASTATPSSPRPCRRGAAAALVVAPHRMREPPIAQVVVDDTRVALGRLAAHWRAALRAAAGGAHRQQRQDHREGDAGRDPRGARADRARRCSPPTGNLNNDIGVPLTLLRAARAAIATR